jgi:hypothetical protein
MGKIWLTWLWKWSLASIITPSSFVESVWSNNNINNNNSDMVRQSSRTVLQKALSDCNLRQVLIKICHALHTTMWPFPHLSKDLFKCLWCEFIPAMHRPHDTSFVNWIPFPVFHSSFLSLSPASNCLYALLFFSLLFIFYGSLALHFSPLSCVSVFIAWNHKSDNETRWYSIEGLRTVSRIDRPCQLR